MNCSVIITVIQILFCSKKLSKAFIFVFTFIVMFAIGCKKFVTIGVPATSINEGNVYKNDATAISVLTGIYTRMAQAGTFTGPSGISIRFGSLADEFSVSSDITDIDLISYYGNQIVSISGSGEWGPIYSYIFQCNAALEGLSVSTTLTSKAQQQLIGEAKFMRAFFYFYLVNMFGDVPLVLGTDYQINRALSRTPKEKVYQQIILDLNDAKILLSEHYYDEKLQNSIIRVRPNKWTAVALLARVYLFVGDWINAHLEANSIISNSSQYKLESLENVFKINSQEAIWQLQSVVADHGTEDAFVYILPDSGPNSDNPVYLSEDLMGSFEMNDNRKSHWISNISPQPGTIYNYPFKYKENTVASGAATQFLTVFRLGEQYLLRAEAQAHGAGGSLLGAVSDLNVIRSRAGLSPYNGPENNKDSVLSAIIHERRIELFSEFGHRWLDLKRTGMVDMVMTSITPLKANGNPWRSYQQLYPIPINEIRKNPNLIQNPGYIH